MCSVWHLPHLNWWKQEWHHLSHLLPVSLQGLREEWWTPNIMLFQSATETFQVASFPLYFMGGSPESHFFTRPPPLKFHKAPYLIKHQRFPRNWMFTTLLFMWKMIFKSYYRMQLFLENWLFSHCSCDVKKTVFDASHWREINMYMFFPSEINISELEYVYRNQGHPLQTMKTNQISGRTETVNSNIFQSSQSNVRYKSMKSLLMMLTAVLLINKLSSSNFYYFRIQLYSALSMG